MGTQGFSAARRKDLPPERIVHNQEKPEFFFREGCYIIEWWNSEEDPSVSIAHVRVEPGGITQFHRLRETTERYVILSGRARVEIGHLPPEEVGPGDVVLIPPDSRQRIANLGHEDLIFLAVCTPRFTDSAYEECGEP